MRQFSRFTRHWFKQWSQPKLLDLAEATLKDRVLWSTQITNFQNGTSKEPGPKVFLALGRLNQQLAAGTCPAFVKHLWEDKTPLLLPDGRVAGPLELFQIFCGEIDLGLPDIPEALIDHADTALPVFCKWLRLELGKQGYDYQCEDKDALVVLAPALKPILSGTKPALEDLLEQLPQIAQILNTNADSLLQQLLNCCSDNA